MAGYDPLKNFNFDDLEVTDRYEVKFISIDDLKDSKENAERTQDFMSRPEDCEKFKEQLATIGLLDPLRVSDLGNGKYRVISGHYRKHCLAQLFKEGKDVYYRDRLLTNDVPCIIEEKKDDDQTMIELIAANSKNNSIKEKLYRTKMAMDIHQRLIDKGADVSPNRNEYVSMITGYSVRSVQMYINQLKEQEEESSKGNQSDDTTSENEPKYQAPKKPIKQVVSSIKKLYKLLDETPAADLEYYEMTPKQLEELNEMLIALRMEFEMISGNCYKFIRLAKAEPEDEEAKNELNEEGRWY